MQYISVVAKASIIRAKITANETDRLKTIEEFGTSILYCSDIQNVDENLQNPKRELAQMNLDETLRATQCLTGLKI